MTRLFNIGLGVCALLALASGEAFARGGGGMGGAQGAGRGGFGAQQSAAAYQASAVRQYQYRMQAHARARQCAGGDCLAYGGQQAAYGTAAQLPLNSALGVMQRQQMQKRIRAGQGGFGAGAATLQPFNLENGLGAAECPFGNQPQALQQQRGQGRGPGAGSARTGRRGGGRQRLQTRVPQ